MRFVTEYRRFYFSKEEYYYRFQIFRMNLYLNKEFNANSENTFVLGINIGDYFENLLINYYKMEWHIIPGLDLY